MSDIKKTITDFVSWDVANDYYNEEKKEELIEQLKEIIFEDEITVRKFLERLFSTAEQTAKSFGLIVNQGDVEEPSEEPEPTEEPEETPEEPTTEEPSEEESEETPEKTEEPSEEEDQNKVESIRRAYVSKAAEYLYE